MSGFYIRTLGRNLWTIKLKNICDTGNKLVISSKRYHLCSKLLSPGNNDSYKNNEPTPPLNKQTAQSLVMKLTEEERSVLLESLKHFDSEKRKEEYKGQLAAFKWRSKFGRPSKVHSLGDVDPTGSYCPVPEDWLLRKYDELNLSETVPKPSNAQLIQVFTHNAIPFVGFGFLDNCIMILCGDSIEMGMGSIITISTMAAAALGNTLSDIVGLGSAYYVEQLAAKIGFKQPSLTPIQLNMATSRRASNLGRVVGVTIGCLLGMTPLLIL